MVVVGVSLSDALYQRIEKLREKKSDGKAVLFKRSPFYAELLEKGLEQIEANNGRPHNH